MSVSPPVRSVWSPTKPSEAGYTSTYSTDRPIHSSTVARYGANETPPWMIAPKFSQHSPRLETGRPAARRARATRSKRIRSHEGIPAALPMSAECLGGHGDHLVAGGGPRRLHPVTGPSRPREVPFAVDGAVPERLESQIVAQGRAGLIVGDRADLLEPMRAAERGPARRIDEIEQCGLLDASGVTRHALERAPAVRGVHAERRPPDPLDHERPPTPRRARVSTSHSAAAALNASGCSSIGAWPQLGRYTS